MYDFLLMDIPDTGYKLGEKLCGISFSQIAVSKDVVEKFTARGILEDDANVLVGFDYIVKTYDVGMFESLYQWFKKIV
jgi:hypothetical protein